MSGWVYDGILVAVALANFGLLWLALRIATRDDPVVRAAKNVSDNKASQG